MSTFTLPSGRQVELADEPNYGQVLEAVDAATAHPTAQLSHYYLSLMVSMSGLPEADIRALSNSDGSALNAEVRNRESGRPEKEEGPFVTSSSPTSADTQSADSPESSTTTA